MRILIVHNRYRQRGGEDVMFEAESRLLERHGHAVRRLSFDNTEIPEHPSAVDAMALAGTTIWSRTAASTVRDSVREFRPDVAHFHNTFPLVSPSAYSACRAEGVAVVQTLHNFRLVCPSATLFRDGRPCEECVGRRVAWPAVEHRCYRGSRTQTGAVVAMLATHRARGTWTNDVDLYIALTAFGRAKFIEGGLPPDRIAVKPCFIEPDPGAGTGERSGYLFVGRLVEEKGVRTLLDAWSSHSIAAGLRIEGLGPMECAVASSAGQSRDRIRYLGRITREAMLDEMRRARALIFPSIWYEGFGNAIAEAFACGLPVIASNLGGRDEIINHWRTGLLFESDNPSALADAVTWAEDHPYEMGRMGIEARREYEKKYSGDVNYAELIELYRRALSNARIKSG